MNLTSSQPKQKEIYERVGYLTILFRDMQPEMGNKMENRFFESGTSVGCQILEQEVLSANVVKV